MYLEQKKKEKNIGKRIETNLVQPRTFLQTFDRRWSVSKDRTSARDNRSRRGRGNRKRSDIEMDANSRNWQTTRSYRWMKTPPDPRRNTSSRVFNVVLLFSPEKRRKNVLTSREHGFHCINFTVMIMISLVETLVIFCFEEKNFFSSCLFLDGDREEAWMLLGFLWESGEFRERAALLVPGIFLKLMLSFVRDEYGF